MSANQKNNDVSSLTSGVNDVFFSNNKIVVQHQHNSESDIQEKDEEEIKEDKDLLLDPELALSEYRDAIKKELQDEKVYFLQKLRKQIETEDMFSPDQSMGLISPEDDFVPMQS